MDFEKRAWRNSCRFRPRRPHPRQPKTPSKRGPEFARATQVRPQLPPTDPVQRGEFIARKLCASCHLFPEPALLDKKTWENGALPMMAARLGVKGMQPDSPQNRGILRDWDEITAFYLETAP